jgi:hypothetical protein
MNRITELLLSQVTIVKAIVVQLLIFALSRAGLPHITSDPEMMVQVQTAAHALAALIGAIQHTRNTDGTPQSVGKL